MMDIVGGGPDGGRLLNGQLVQLEVGVFFVVKKTASRKAVVIIVRNRNPLRCRGSISAVYISSGENRGH